MSTVSLQRFFENAANEFPANVALIESDGGSIHYADLDVLTQRVRDRLGAFGVRPNDRVGIFMQKSIDAVAVLLGALRAGCAYVPVDPNAPVARGAYILQNCEVAALFIEKRYEEAFRNELAKGGVKLRLIVLETVGGGEGLAQALDALDAESPSTQVATVESASTDLAYILYTSGSTGLPKGVTLTQENATSFVDWCSETLTPTTNDRFSSHAPLHFDLSILDIFVALKHGASVVLIGDALGKDPARLAQLIEDTAITCWYSAPSILSLLAQFGALDQRDYSKLRLVLFAGEVFPIKHLKSLAALLPHPKYFNLYGPTETNVCTFYEVPLPIPDERTTPVPIGQVCSHLQGRVVDERGEDVKARTEGELCIAGRGVMRGYWAAPDQTKKAFLPDGTWYRTGDLVIEDAAGQLIYVGRRDRMVKRRGYRIELGEIESGLYRHPEVREAAVVARSSEEGVVIVAFLSGATGKRLSIIEMKRHCSTALPSYMIPDRFTWLDALPKTSTDKLDYRRLSELV